MRRNLLKSFKAEILFVSAFFVFIIAYAFSGLDFIKFISEGKSVGFLSSIFGKQNVYLLSKGKNAEWVFYFVFLSFFLFFMLIRMAIKKKETVLAHYKIICVIFFILYLIFSGTTFFFQKNSLQLNKDFFEYPIINDDYAGHFVDAVESSHFFRTKQRIWGYNPYCFAGYPSGIYIAIDNHWAFLFVLVFGNFLNPAFVFNLSILLSFLILPLLAFFAAKNFGLGKLNSLFCFILSMYLVAGFYKLRGFYGFGGYSFVLTVFLSLFVTSLFYAYIHKKKLSTLVLIAFFGSLAFFVHPLSAFLCFVLCLPFLIFYFNRLHFKDYLKVMICMVFVFVTNLIWVSPYLKFKHLIPEKGWSEYMQTDVKEVLSTWVETRSFIFLFLLFLFFLYKSFKAKKYKFAASISISYIIFLTISLCGTQLGLSNLQPTRYIILVALLSVLSISKLVEDQFKEKNLVFVVLVPFMIIFLILGSYPTEFSFGYLRYPAAKVICQFVGTSLSKDARIHVQDSSDHPYFGCHFTACLPYRTKREMLAGPYTFPPTKNSFTQFVNNELFGKEILDITEKEWQEYLELYNIRYFLVYGQKARRFFNRNKRFKRIFHYSRFSIYEYLAADNNFCYRCDADVKADYDKITVSNAKSDVTILKYHYIKTLKIKPKQLKIKPIKLLDDPIPFIMIENGSCADFTIYN